MDELIKLLKSFINDRIERIENDIKELFQKNNENTNRQSITETKLDTVINLMNDMKNKIDEIAQRPGKRWDTLVMIIITAVVGVVIGMLFGKTL